MVERAEKMFQAVIEKETIRLTFSSTMALVDQAVVRIEKMLLEKGTPACFEFKVVLRELLINAVEHGNGSLPHLNVTCRIWTEGKRMCIEVTDEGEGFDPERIDMNMPEDPLSDRNRGYALISAFSRKLSFNGKGNSVTAYVDSSDRGK